MGPEELGALTAAAGAAVVQAAGTDAWAGIHAWWSRWWGRVGEMLHREELQREELERLDADGTTLPAASEPEAANRAGYWTGRFETLLGLLPPEEREKAVAELRALVGQRPSAQHGDTTVNVSGDAQVQNGDHNYMVNNFGSPS
ncbi:hypothetical protein [Streptomyces sp. 891-h]|uniref:hypothetical protein n=1 Tax=Streptomyces sp. 891-h TaxID=2720714 RepID=UPI001FAAF5BF|nr:hypothetical protein [Streptomyces sp. 891-h]UNZ18143.1 hypothetical protein HC362_14885 [Streptomyces sp. 891-h]